jgi:tRNA A-37 threonylcarbamoyl transferase component Bud32/predicted nucleotidyltransferase
MRFDFSKLRTLDSSEISRISTTLAPIRQRGSLLAVAVYGSQISGYARKESDYDVIVVLAPFTQRIKYYYLKGDVQCSALVVEEKTFDNDCQKSSLGEFVSGRLLNPYEALLGKEYLRNNETLYKQRVILEGLSEAYTEYGRFAENIEFPLSFFLFEKLRKRAAIYPPVVYSYALTYGNGLQKSNVESSMEGFRQAADRLAIEGLIEFNSENDSVKIKSDKIKGGFSVKLASTASYTARGIRQYAVHGYAGRVGLDVVGREVISKLERAKDHSELPEVITNPKLAWKLNQGKLFAGSTDWFSDLLDYFQMSKASTITTKKALGEIYNSTSFYTLVDTRDGKTISIAVKRYNDVKGMKWGLLNLWSLKNTNFSANANERMHREFRAIEQFKNLGLFTPEILAVFLDDKILVTQYIKGKNLSSIQSEYLNEDTDDLSPQRSFGSILAVVHGAGSCIGDTKPSNAILSESNSRIYLTDLEQAHANGNLAWDIAEFIYYSVRFTLREERARKLVNEFVSGYLDGGGDPKIIEQTSALRYRAPFQAFIAPNVLNALRKDLANA